jgi:hypothetical protein
MRLHMLAFAATFALAACATPQDDAAPTPAADAPVASAPAPASTTAAPPTMEACNADAAKDAVGKQATDDVIEQARIAAGAKIARALRPDMMVTMEYRGDRLNLRTDTDGKVVGVSCG